MRWDSRLSFWQRALGHLAQRYWLARISHVLRAAREAGVLSDRQFDALDFRIKFSPDSAFERPKYQVRNVIPLRGDRRA